MSAYDDLKKEFPELVALNYYSPIPCGVHTDRTEWTEITDAVDAMTAGMPEDSSTAKMRCNALKTFLQRGDSVHIRTATNYGHARFWAKRKA